MSKTLICHVAKSTPLAVTGAALSESHVINSLRYRARHFLSFRSVNHTAGPDYDPGLQRHHLLPKQLLNQRCFGPMLDTIGRDRFGFDDFRSNGLLLPSNHSAAIRMGLPMHRGPHRDYNALVMERVGQVEARWSVYRAKASEMATVEAVQRLTLLQKALRRRLLNPHSQPIILNRFDPMQKQVDFTELDAMVDMLWPETQEMADLGL
jgi:hypothetical protein